jgi:hypothetical protein
MAYQNRFARERRRRRALLITKTSLALAVAAGLVGLGYSAYLTGTELAFLRVGDLESRNTRLTKERDDARAEASRSQSSLNTLRQEKAELQARYAAEVPGGAMADMFGLVQQRLRKGVDPARLAEVLREAAPVQPCDTRTLRKRHPIQLASTRAPDMAVFLEGLISVSVTIPSVTASPSQSATVTIATAWSDEPMKVTGLPAKRDIVINNAALHLTVDASDVPGFAAVAVSVCGRG